ncbi:phage baseplate protein [Dyella mobilis]|uniref:Dit-like phage tail protein N-terminal domain-containing protein n=1 Tax=Dyella mobilis TaxID=1849582 RepID=A0ABS2KKD8_9GAMM|nr:hypothetical protein [Dyella mobilis]MBM7131549.1 hypothetical protein [Dyella mobilis]GLQ96480.1 hypothetical protein GCM10007863_08980 [Dyella mobilis]
MSGLSALGIVLAGSLEDVLLRTSRSIGTIIPQCTVEERVVDELEITDHPIEQGADITDHAFKRPSIVTARYGWSNSGSIFNLTTGGIVSSDPVDIYNQLLALQASRQPFTLQTGKLSYDNVLIKTIEQLTDMKTENALSVTITFKQIIIVSLQATTLQAANQANPAQTAPVTNGGTVQPNPVPTSVLSTITSYGAGVQ